MQGYIGRVILFTRVLINGINRIDVLSDPGGGPNTTAGQFSDGGDDSPPLPTDSNLHVPLDKEGRTGIAGHIDTKNTGKALAGEKRIYARDPNGVTIAEVWIHGDGLIELIGPVATVSVSAAGDIIGSNDNGFFHLEEAGDFVGNDARMTTDGDVITSDGISLRGHGHNQANDSANDVQATTGAPNVP